MSDYTAAWDKGHEIIMAKAESWETKTQAELDAFARFFHLNGEAYPMGHIDRAMQFGQRDALIDLGATAPLS